MLFYDITHQRWAYLSPFISGTNSNNAQFKIGPWKVFQANPDTKTLT